MRKAVVFIMLLALVGGASFAGGQRESSGGKKQLVVTFWGGAAKNDAFKQTAAAFMKNSPSVDVQLLDIPSADYTAKVLAMISGGTPPDVININAALAAALGKSSLVPLSKRMRDLGYFDSKSGLWKGWYNLLALSGEYKPGQELYQVPLGTGSDVLAYNKDLFDKAGVAYPTEKWTWQDLISAAQKLTTGSTQWGISGFAYRGLYILIPMAKDFGGDVYDLSNLTFTGDSPNVIKAFQLAQDMIYKDKVAPTPAEAQANGGQSGGVFQNGHAAMYFLPTFQFPPMYKNAFHWDIMRLPSGPDGSWSSIYGGKLAILQSSKMTNTGFDFINMVNGPIGQKYFSIDSGFNDPPLKKIAYSKEFLQGPSGAPAHNSYRVSVLEQSVVITPSLPNADKINTLWNNELSLFWENKIDAKTMLGQVATKIKPLLSSN